MHNEFLSGRVVLGVVFLHKIDDCRCLSGPGRSIEQEIWEALLYEYVVEEISVGRFQDHVAEILWAVLLDPGRALRLHSHYFVLLLKLKLVEHSCLRQQNGNVTFDCRRYVRRKVNSAAAGRAQRVAAWQETPSGQPHSRHPNGM